MKRACACVLGLAVVSAVGQGGPLLGTAWYPEQWPEGRWETDLSLMQQAHMNVVRVGEFAWSTMEPREGTFDFGWLDRAIALAGRHGIRVVLGTPSAAPPAWLTQRYPETLRLEEDGRRAEHGGRQQFSVSDAKYRELAVRVAHALAVRYGHNPNVVGWQIDNEIGAPTFDDVARTQWHAWLKAKYVTVAELNRRWATAYWSQTYDSFDEVPYHSKSENPALLLDYKRFVTATWVNYVQDQARVIRAVADRRQFVTTNTMHWNTTFDHYAMHKDLDIAAWDDYFPDGHLDAGLNAAEHDLVRGYKQKNFWLMETQPAFVNWGAVNAALPPGVTREMAWQAVGHGADAVLYWQWRPALNGQEQYHGSLLGADGLPVPVFAEVEKVGEEFARVAKALPHFNESAPRNAVAMLQSYEANWAIQFQRHTNKFDYVSSFLSFYRAVEPLSQGVDVVGPDAVLTQYKVVYAPALNILSPALAAKLMDYVRGGGVLVLGPRSGMKDADNGLQPMGQPGPLADVLGAKVAQFYALDAPVALAGTSGSGKASVWGEELRVSSPDTEVLLHYGEGNGWLTGKPAAVSHAVGKGKIVYFGSDLDAALMRAEVKTELDAAGVAPLLPGLPEGVELMRRAGSDGEVWVLVNHNASSAKVGLEGGGTDLLTGKDRVEELAGHGVAVWLKGAK